jgi:hypothetical protein
LAVALAARAATEAPVDAAAKVAEAVRVTEAHKAARVAQAEGQHVLKSDLLRRSTAWRTP